MIRRVEAEGNKNASLIILGEAPGSNEVREGRPFIGSSGNLLNMILQGAQVLRNNCYITNVVKEQPTGGKRVNDITPIIDVSKKEPKESSLYREYIEELTEELRGCSATTILAFGNIPLYAATGIYPPKITKRRGSVYPCILDDRKKVVAAIHPAACLYGRKSEEHSKGMYLWRHFIMHDVKKAVKESKTSGIAELSIHCIVSPTFSDVIDFIKEAYRHKEVAVDIETPHPKAGRKLEVLCISIAYDNVSMSIPFARGYEDYFSPDQEAEIWLHIARLLEDEGITKIGQNFIFDTQFLFRKYGIRTKNIEDTMIAHALLIPDFPKGLDFINSIYGSEPYYKDDGKQNMYEGRSNEEFWLYNAKDSAVCIETFPKIKVDLKILGNVEAYEKQRDLIEVLCCMSERGIRMDVEGLRSEAKKVGDRIDELGEKLNRMVGYEINPASPKQLSEYFYDTKRYKPYKKRGTGKVTTDEDALKRLSRKGAPEASILLEIRRLAKLKGTYLDVKLDEDNRLRCSFNPAGAADSGRLSSSKTIWGTGMNLQNDPPEFKKFMLFDERCVGYNIDLKQAENMVVAYIAPEREMIDAFETGSDIHSRTASLICKMSEEQVMQEDKDEVKCALAGGQYTWRFWGKKANHGLNYGLGYQSFAFYYEMPEIEAKFIVQAYHNAYPGIRIYHNWVQEQLSRDRMITNLLGRKRLFMDRWGDGLFKEAYSYIPQSTVAGIINERGLYHIYSNQDKYKNVELLNQVHDSVVFQIPLSVGWKEHAAILLSIKSSLEIPLEYRGRQFIIPADLQIGKNMKDMDGVEWKDVDGLALELENEWKRMNE